MTLSILVIAWLVYLVVTKAIEADRDAKLARVKADLKLRLLERIQDPAEVQRLLDRDFELSEEGMALQQDALRARARTEKESRKQRDSGWRFGLGMMAFILGAVLIALSFGVRGGEEMMVTGGVFFGCGWALLAWYVFDRDQRRRARLESEQDALRS